MTENKKKSEKLLRNIIVWFFLITILGGIYFAMSVKGPLEGSLEPTFDAPLETPPNIEEFKEG